MTGGTRPEPCGFEQGVNVHVVQEILGWHSDLRVTQRYTHVASPVARDAAEGMGRALWGR